MAKSVNPKKKAAEGFDIPTLVGIADTAVRAAWGGAAPDDAAVAVRVVPGSNRTEVYVVVDARSGSLVTLASSPPAQVYEVVRAKTRARRPPGAPAYLEIVDSEADIGAARSPIVPVRCKVTETAGDAASVAATAVADAMVSALVAAKTTTARSRAGRR